MSGTKRRHSHPQGDYQTRADLGPEVLFASQPAMRKEFSERQLGATAPNTWAWQYASVMTPKDSGHPVTVRLFPDFAGTVLWMGGPVDYEATGLTSRLIGALQTWEELYYLSLTPDLQWVSAEAARRFTAKGEQLAGCLAEELGEGYQIEFTSYEKTGAPAGVFRSSGPARNADAVARFNALAAALQAQVDEGDKARVDRQRGKEWYAWAPLSGDSFTGRRSR